MRRAFPSLLRCLLSAILLAVIATASIGAPPATIALPNVPLREGPIPGTPPRIEIRKNNAGALRVFVDGAEFPLRGAGGASAPGLLEQLKLAGGNCVRTWGVETLETPVAGGERYLDHAYRLGLMVVAGIWIEHERHGFDYGNPAMVARQRAKVLAAVRRYKHHPGLLIWGLGNEMEGPESRAGSSAALREVNALAELVKAEDPAHPVMTVIAFNPAKIASVLRDCPHIDILGVNSYSGAASAGESLKHAGWSKPFVVSEFGTNGPWEVAKTAWGAAYEPTSTEKARSYYAAHRLVYELNDGKELCLGTFPFLWGWKQECTATWFGMFLPTLEKLPAVDAMTKAWTGHWPTNRCPKINRLSSTAAGKVVAPGATLTAALEAEDPDGDTLRCDWLVVGESTDRKSGGDAEAAPPAFPDLVRSASPQQCTFLSPTAAGNYRLFVTLHDGRGGAATANFPFRVATKAK